jgi:hypothetical protein
MGVGHSNDLDIGSSFLPAAVKNAQINCAEKTANAQTSSRGKMIASPLSRWLQRQWRHLQLLVAINLRRFSVAQGYNSGRCMLDRTEPIGVDRKRPKLIFFGRHTNPAQRQPPGGTGSRGLCTQKTASAFEFFKPE